MYESGCLIAVAILVASLMLYWALVVDGRSGSSTTAYLCIMLDLWIQHEESDEIDSYTKIVTTCYLLICCTRIKCASFHHTFGLTHAPLTFRPTVRGNEFNLVAILMRCSEERNVHGWTRYALGVGFHDRGKNAFTLKDSHPLGYTRYTYIRTKTTTQHFYVFRGSLLVRVLSCWSIIDLSWIFVTNTPCAVVKYVQFYNVRAR